MKKNTNPLLVILAAGTIPLIVSCGTLQHGGKSVQSYGWDEISVNDIPNESEDIVLRVAFIGDGEPKPCALFPHTEAAVNQINTISSTHPIDFVIGIGDVAHKGTEIQYETATEVFKNLSRPFYPIMGNEEHGNSVEMYMEFAKQWNREIKSPNYVLNHPNVAFVLSSPDFSRDYTDKGIRKLAKQIRSLAPKPVILVVHSAQKGIYGEAADKGIGNELFTREIISLSNLNMVVSGDLHMDLDRSFHSKKMGDIHYLHIPALERTKIPDDTAHNPMIRILTIRKNGESKVETYKPNSNTPVEKYNYQFNLK